MQRDVRVALPSGMCPTGVLLTQSRRGHSPGGAGSTRHAEKMGTLLHEKQQEARLRTAETLLGSALPSGWYLVSFLAAVSWFWGLVPHLPAFGHPAMLLPATHGQDSPCPFLSLPSISLSPSRPQGAVPWGPGSPLPSTAKHRSVFQADFYKPT